MSLDTPQVAREFADKLFKKFKDSNTATPQNWKDLEKLVRIAGATDLYHVYNLWADHFGATRIYPYELTARSVQPDGKISGDISGNIKTHKYTCMCGCKSNDVNCPECDQRKRDREARQEAVMAARMAAVAQQLANNRGPSGIFDVPGPGKDDTIGGPTKRDEIKRAAKESNEAHHEHRLTQAKLWQDWGSCLVAVGVLCLASGVIPYIWYAVIIGSTLFALGICSVVMGQIVMTNERAALDVLRTEVRVTQSELDRWIANPNAPVDELEKIVDRALELEKAL